MIRAEADLSRFSEAEADVAVRMIHACGVVEAAQHFVFSYNFVLAARWCPLAGAPILCDAEMVAGVTRARLPADNEVICTLRDPQTAEIAARIGNTRSAAAMRLWGDRSKGAAVAIGNAPAALLCLLLRNARGQARRGRPRSSGTAGSVFVGAAESEEALAANSLDIPFAIVRGRMGGSAMTAGAVDASGEARPLNMQAKGRLIGVGTGPGDPELLTLKAVRALEEADVVAHFAKRGNNGNARAIVGPSFAKRGWIIAVAFSRDNGNQRFQRLPGSDSQFYEEYVHKVEKHLEMGRTFTVLSEGDSFFYGSYMHLHVRLAHRYPTEVIPGVTAMSGCWSQTGVPIVQGTISTPYCRVRSPSSS